MSTNVAPQKKPARDPRNGNRLAATLATVLTILGHSILGFEQAVAHVFVAVLTGYTCALLFETVDARANKRPAGYSGGGFKKLADYLVSVHMTSITTSFLIYTGDRFFVMMFCVALAVGSKYLFRVRLPNGRYVHFFNPSNFGIAVTLFLFPWVSIIPYAFLTWTRGWQDLIPPVIIFALGTRLNLLFTKRIPLILTWALSFVGQAVVRSVFFGTPFLCGVSPMGGVAFVLFSFYMITDPMTSPSSLRGQIVFGMSLATAYAVLMVNHVIFTLFYAVFFVTGLRGAVLFVESVLASRRAAVAPSLATGT